MLRKNAQNKLLKFRPLLWVIVFSTILHPAVFGQVPGLPGGVFSGSGEETDESTAEQRLAIDRKTTQTLNSLRERLKAGDIGRAIDDFRVLKTADPLTLVPSTIKGVYIPLFRAVFLASFRIPEAKRLRLAETEAARSAVALASTVGDSRVDAIPELILRSAGTPAAVKAHLVAARLHLSRGNYFAATSWLTPLTASHLPKDIQTAGLAMLEVIPSAKSPERVSSDPKPVVLPRHLVWQSRPPRSPRLKKQLETFLKAANVANVIPQCSWQDVVEDGVIFRRSFRGLAAIEQKSGLTKWEYPVGRSLDSLITSDRANVSIFAKVSADNATTSSFRSLEQGLLVSTFCRDNSVGRIAADEDRLYIVTSGRRSSTSTSRLQNFMPSTGSLGTGGSSRLIAVEKQTGRRVWTLGRAALEEQLGSSDSGDWFAGPPYPSGQKLYSVFEWDGEMRLGCVMAATGELLWTTPLAFPEQSISKDGVRQYWGATPIRHAGLVWCPTTTGWLVCVDELTQSVAYATKIQTGILPQPRVTFGRNQTMALTPYASLNDRWSVPKLIPVKNRMAVVTNESREIHLIESATGRLIHKIDVNPGEVLLHADAKQLVLSSSKTIRSLVTSSGSENWSQPLTAETGYPCGKAAIQADELLIPLNTGTIVRCSLKTGQFTEKSPAVIPAGSWGRLVASPELDGDLLFLSPDRASRLSPREADSTPGSPLEIAEGLLAARKWAAALQAAIEIPRSSEGYTEAQSIIFESRLRLAANDPALHLPELKKAQLNQNESIQVDIFDAAVSFNNGDLTEACAKLVGILNNDESILRGDVPAIANMWATSAADVASTEIPTARQSVRAWASARLTGLMTDLPESSLSQIELDSLQDESMLAIGHRAILPLLHTRMAATDSLEFWWHAMVHCLDLQVGSDNDLNEELRLAADRVDALNAADELPTASRTLLAESLSQLSTEFGEIAHRFGLELSARSESHREQLVAKFRQWDADQFKVIPVNRLSTFGSASARVRNSIMDDVVLGPYNWRVIRNSLGRLQAKGVVDDLDQWSIPGQFPVYGMYSTATDLLQRYGSVIVLNTARKLAAISLLDQRIIWEKTISGGTSGIVNSRSRNFEQFVATRDRLPSRLVFTMSSICGSGQRWMCVQTGKQVEVLDSLTGQRQWSVDLDGRYNRVIATDDFVIVGASGDTSIPTPPDRELKPTSSICFDRRTGDLVELADVATIARHAIRNVGPLAVVWRPAKEDAPNFLEWVNLKTAEVSRKVSLEGFSVFQFLDDRTLVGISDSSELMTIDLVDGQTRRMSFGAAEVSSVDQVTDDKQDDKPGPAPKDERLWSPHRVQVFADHLNYYVSNRPVKNVVAMPPPAGMAFQRFEGPLRAIDRSSGKLNWVMKNDAVLLAATDHPEIAALVLMEDSNQVVRRLPGQVAGQSLFRGISKLTGEEFFRQAVPSRFGLRYVRLDSPGPNVLDIAVYGMRVRMQGVP